MKYIRSGIRSYKNILGLPLRLFTLFITVAAILLFPAGGIKAVSALSDTDINSIYNDTVWYSLDNSSCSVNVDVNLSGTDNIQKAFNFFVSEGHLTANQAAGITGNMIWESGINPEKVQGGSISKNPADAGSNGWGIVQWTPANTKVPGIVRDAKINTPVYELSTQLEMVWDQLTGKAGGYSETQAGNDVKGTTTVEDAVRAFQGDKQIGGKYFGFERPKDEGATLTKRISLANQVLHDFGGADAGTVIAAPGDSSANGCSSSVGPGQDTKYIDGFTIYNQCDSSWANKPYGDSTICAAGCGPSAMAMIITALTDQRVTPDETTAYANSLGLHISGQGSSWRIAPDLAAHWHLNAQLIGANVAKITATLQSGGLVIVAGQGPLPFSSGGHYLVIRAVTSDGKWKVGDSGHNNTSDQKWDPQQLVTYMNDGSAYAITK